MKPHRILKTFKGSQTGNDHHAFLEGDEKPLSASLAAIVVPLGWAKPVDGNARGAEEGADGRKRELKAITADELKALGELPSKELRKAAAQYGVKAGITMGKQAILDAIAATAEATE